MGKPRSVFNRDSDIERTQAKQYAQARQDITGMSSTFRGMPVNAPQVSGGQTDRVGQDTLKTKTMYLNSLRVDSITRVDLATVSGGAGITSTVASGQFLDFKVGSTSLLNIGPTNVTFKNTVLAPAIDFGTAASTIGTVYADAVTVTEDLTVSGDVILGNSTASDTIQIDGLFTAQLNINGQDMFFDVDRDSKIYSGSDDSIKIVTGGTLRVEFNNSGIGLNDDLYLEGNVFYLDSDQDTSIHSTTDDSIQVSTGGSVRLAVNNVGTTVSGTLLAATTFQAYGNVLLDSDTTLGTYSGGHEVNLNAKLDFRDHTNSTNQTASDSDGYIEILVGGLAKKLYYY